MSALRRAGVAGGFAIVGVLVGAVTTLASRGLAPWGLVACALVVAALVAGARLAAGSRLAGGAAGLGVLLAVGVLAMPRDGEAVLVPDDALGLAWVVAVAVVTVVAVAWPAPRARPGAHIRTE